MKEVVLPKNIRQIGEIQSDKKIYLEDYVMTYIRKKEKEGLEGSVGVLFGKQEQDDQGRYLFLTGAVLLDQEADVKDRWKKVEEEKKNYFPDLELWGYFLIGTVEEEQMEELTGRLEEIPTVIFHIQEGEEHVYWSEKKQYHRIKGYFVFYERNPQMQRYIAEAETPKRVEEEGVSDKAIVSFREKVKEKGATKKGNGIRYLASSFLVLTILLLGVTIINNYDRMKSMEKLMEQITLERQMQEPSVQVVSLEAETEEELPITGGEQEINTDIDETNLQEVSADPADGTDLQEMSAAEANETSLQEMDTEVQEVMAEISVAEQSMAERAYSAENLSELNLEGLGKTDEILASIQRQNQSVYTIRYGDTLADISEKYYGTLEMVQEICEINEIEDANLIVPGEKIVLP